MDPHIALALALHSRPGSVLLLLGTGISAGSRMPAAWEVREDLMRRVACASGEPEPADAERWWATSGGSSGYDDLCAELAPTPAGRKDQLRGYFEPSEDERERGDKMPGAAHHALARLVAAGRVRGS